MPSIIGGIKVLIALKISVSKIEMFLWWFVTSKEDELNKENYQPVSVLSHASKIFEILQPNKSFLRT